MRLTILLLLLSTAMPLGIAHAADRSIACCDSAEDAGSCWPLSDPADQTECDPAAEQAWCELDLGEPIYCEPITLDCCPVVAGVVWVDSCSPMMPGTVCIGTVLGSAGG